MRLYRKTLPLLCLAFAPLAAQAITLDGPDLLAAASFPNNAPTLVGTSLFFGPATHYTFEKVMSLPVSQYLDNGTLSVTFNLTKHDCAPGTCGIDSNPIFGLSDGNTIVVMSIGEDGNGAIGASAMSDHGDYALGFAYAQTLAWGYGFPAEGGQISFHVDYHLNGTTTITDGSVNSAQVTYTHPYALNPANLSLVLIHDNDLGEQYQIDSLEIASRDIAVPVDIKPGSCPNAVALGKQGVLPVAIAGTENVSALDIDPETVRVAGVAPLRSSIEDVATPYLPLSGKSGRLDCTTATADGIVDLSLKFSAQDVLQSLGAGAVGETLVVPVTGALRDGTPFNGEDVIWTRP